MVGAVSQTGRRDRLERALDAAADVDPRQTLNANLRRLGLTTTAAGHGRKHVLRDGQIVFTGRAGDVWAWLRAHQEAA